MIMNMDLDMDTTTMDVAGAPISRGGVLLRTQAVPRNIHVSGCLRHPCISALAQAEGYFYLSPLATS